jgi:hypothetical protein
LTVRLHRACAEESRVRPDRPPFYVRWAKDFDNFLQGKPLKDRSGKDIEAFLSDLGKRRDIGAGAVGHADVATIMIYTHVLNRSGISVNPVRKDGALPLVLSVKELKLII